MTDSLLEDNTKGLNQLLVLIERDNPLRQVFGRTEDGRCVGKVFITRLANVILVKAQ